jgi:hypothetical protein
LRKIATEPPKSNLKPIDGESAEVGEAEFKRIEPAALGWVFFCHRFSPKKTLIIATPETGTGQI